MTNGIIPESMSVWPAGHRAALAIVVAVEGTVSAHAGEPPDVGVDYAATGLQRMLDLLEDFDVSVTTAWTDSALNSLPQILRRVAEQGHEIAGSFGGDETISTDSPLIGALKRVSGQEVTGVIGVGTVVASSSRGNGDLAWQITGSGGDLPAVTGGSPELPPLIQIPTSPYWNDRTWLHAERPLPPSSLLEAWSTSLASIRTDGSLMTVLVHPHIILRPGFSATLVRFLDEIISSGDVWLTRLDHIATWWSQRQPNS